MLYGKVVLDMDWWLAAAEPTLTTSDVLRA